MCDRKIFLWMAVLLLSTVSVVTAQKTSPLKPETGTVAPTPVASAAYAEILLKKAELLSELESLALDYTDDFPRIKQLKFVLTLFDRDIGRLAKVKPAEASKLTEALGRLIVKRIDLESDLWKLRETYQDEHPEVKRARRRIEIYDNAINQILE